VIFAAVVRQRRRPAYKPRTKLIKEEAVVVVVNGPGIW
jgi:hypothetical protein